MRFKDKVAIVAGGGSGTGRGLCLRYGQEGTIVVVAELNMDAAGKAAGKSKPPGGKP